MESYLDLIDEQVSDTKNAGVQKKESAISSGELNDLLLYGTPEGGRNNKLMSFAGILRNLNMSQSMIEGILKAVNSYTNMNLPEREVVTIAKSASRYPVKEPTQNETKGEVNIRTVKFFEDELNEARKNGFVHRGLSTGWKSVDENYLICKKMLNVVTGIPGHGKSEFVDALMLNTSIKHDWKWIVFSPENYPVSLHIRKLIEKYIKKPFKVLTDLEHSKAIDFLNDHFYIIPPEDNGFTLNSIIDKINGFTNQNRVDGVLVDPWNEIVPQMDKNEVETNYIGRCLSKCRHFARSHDLTFFIVAHPTKMQKEKDGSKYCVPTLYDVKGSSTWYDKCDNGITIYRDFESDSVEVHIQKVKFKLHGRPNMVQLQYNKDTGEYYEM